jgi:hypothetical protein
MAGETNAVTQDYVISDVAIVRDVSVSHKEAIVTNAGTETASFCAPVNGYKFPDSVAIPDARECPLTFILQILRGHPD